MATAGESFLRKQHLDLLNRLRRMGSGKMKLASEMAPEKRAVIVKRIMMKAKPIHEGIVPKEAHEKAAIGQGSLTPTLTPGKYTNEKAVRDAGPNGYRSPIWSAHLGAGKLASSFSGHLETVLSNFRAVAKKEAPIGGAPPTSSHAGGTIRELGKIRPPQDDVNKKLADEKIAGWIMSGLRGLAGKMKPMAPAAVPAVRPPQPPGMRAAMFGKGPKPGIHTGVDVSKAMGSGPSSGGWEHLGVEEARAMLKLAIGGAA